ncbi:ABC transporter ATP-binding protein [Cellulomonas sp. Y8]|uniref:ABC transporter ATP-binding protein n=1 Tax=Cellulomonas sp. Y8 TaxID=2591145 RepID=UPI003D7581F0
MSAPGDALVVDSVTIARRRRVLVDGASFRVRSGTVHALLGHNGAGKTTLLRALAGQVPLTSGTIRVDVRPSVLFVGSRYPSDLTVGQIVEHHRRRLGRSDPAAVAAVLETLGVREFAERSGGALSTGMAQRVSIALALLAGPRLLVLDEPTTGLDPQGVAGLRDVIGRLRREGTAVLVCSHDLAELELVCDDVTCLRGGRVTASGSVPEVTRGLPAAGHLLRTADDGRTAEILAARGAQVAVTARGVHLPAGADLSTAVQAVAGEVTVHEATVDHGLFARLYDAFGSAPGAGRTRRRHRR